MKAKDIDTLDDMSVYNDREIEWAFSYPERLSFPNKKLFLADIRLRKGSKELLTNFSRIFNAVVLPSGRVRNWTTYCQTKNTPFQGIAADGAKTAHFELVKAGFRVINFIHDEALIELKIDSNLKDQEQRISDIMISSMNVFCPDVKIKVEAQYMFNWAKEGTHTLDNNGTLIEKTKSV